MPKKQELVYIGARISKENYWQIKKALFEKQEKFQDAIINSLALYLKITLSSPKNKN